MSSRSPILVLLFLPLLQACSDDSGKQAAAPAPPPSVIVDEVRAKHVSLKQELVGRVKAREQVEIRARITGYLKKRHFREGDDVRKGDMLFSIEPDRYEALVAQAKAAVSADEARLKDALLKLERVRKLEQSNNVSQQDLDSAIAAELAAQAAVQASKAQLQQSELDLSYTKVTAPIAGTISTANYDEGSLIGPDSGVLATIVNLDPVEVTVNISDVQYLEFSRAMKAKGMDNGTRPSVEPALLLGDGTRFEHRGRFEVLDNTLNPETGTIAVTAVFPNPDKLLRPGMFVTVEVEKPDQPATLTVPQAAVQTSQAGYSVLVVKPDNKVEQRFLKLGKRVDTLWIVESGLESGERIIVDGLLKAKPGQEVNPVSGQPD